MFFFFSLKTLPRHAMWCWFPLRCKGYEYRNRSCNKVLLIICNVGLEILYCELLLYKLDQDFLDIRYNLFTAKMGKYILYICKIVVHFWANIFHIYIYIKYLPIFGILLRVRFMGLLPDGKRISGFSGTKFANFQPGSKCEKLHYFWFTKLS